MKEKALVMDVSMLEARRSEKDFFARHDLAYVDKVKASVAEVKKEAGEYRHLMSPRKERTGR